MSSHETRVWDTPDEERLAALMDNASKLIVPSDGYSLDLKLFGVVPDMSTFQELQAHYQAYLDRVAGSEFHYTLHGTADKLTMTEFSAALPRDSGDIRLEKSVPTEMLPYEYLPSVDVLGEHHEAKEPAWDKKWHVNLDDRLATGHGIDILRPKETDHYRVWLGQAILSKCRSWRLVEERTLGYSVVGKYAEKYSIVRKQDVPGNANISTETLSIVSELTDLHEETNPTTIQQRLDMVSHQSDVRFVRIARPKRGENTRRSRKQVRSRGAEAKDISYFTDVVEQLLSDTKA